MNNEEKILSMLETLVTKVDSLEHKFDGLDNKVSCLAVTAEDIQRNVTVIAEGHSNLNNKLDELKELSNLQNDVSVLKAITADNMYDIKALKIAR